MEIWNKVCDFVSATFGVSSEIAGYLVIGACALIVVVIITAIAVAVHKKKKRAKRSSAPAEEIAPAPQPAVAEKTSQEPVAEKDAVREEKTEKTEEPVNAEEPAKTVKATKADDGKKKTPEKTAKKEKTEKSAPVKTEIKEEKFKLGKWVIEEKSEDEFIAVLFASNGEIMLTSEIYTTEDGARKGVATIIKAVNNGEFVTHRNKNGTFYFKLKSANNRLLCAGEIYKEKSSCLSAVESVKRIAADSPIAEETAEGDKYVEYTPATLSEKDIENAAAGKWKIEKSEEGKYYATLYASNGQVMISTEEVSAKATALSGMENAKANAIAGNFVIDRDKFGKFYYKLRNAQKSVICIGESYVTADNCVSALESVRKLAAKSQLAE